jgi:transposase-like protein
MRKPRKSYTGAEQLAILREPLIERVPISELCEKHGLPPTGFYARQERRFEGGAAVVGNGPAGRCEPDVAARRIEALPAKRQPKNEGPAERMEAHVALKKRLGEA